MPRKTTKTDLHQRITDQIAAALERGVKPWAQPWKGGHAAGPISRPLRYNREPYHGINVLVLWATAAERGFSAPIWMTYRQAQALGANVRKGEKGVLVVYASVLERSETDPETGDDIDQRIPFLKGYTVFNIDQIDGLPDDFHTPSDDAFDNPDARDAAVEQFFAQTKAEIRHGDQAYYQPSTDHIQLPPFERFRDAVSYYATLSHECIHWTRQKSRLDRSFGRERWGDAGYAREELVAELGAAFLCADLGLTLEDREDHASYIASWIKVLKNDKRAIFEAAAHAEKAVAFLCAQDDH